MFSTTDEFGFDGYLNCDNGIFRLYNVSVTSPNVTGEFKEVEIDLITGKITLTTAQGDNDTFQLNIG